MNKLKILSMILIAIFVLAACTPAEPEVVVTTIVETVIETVEVEGEVVEVEKEVIREVEVIVTPTPLPPGPKILRIAFTPDLYQFDEDVPTSVTVGENMRIFDTLTRFDENFGVQPWLATEWEYDSDRSVWVFHLRDDVFFHDGVQMTAHHIADYFNYIAIESSMATSSRLGEGDSVAVDDFTIEFSSTNIGLPRNLTHSTQGIRRGDPFAGEHIGTGPFIFKEYVPNEFISVVKNPDWWGGEPTIDGIELRFIPDPITRLLALQAGEVDLIAEPPRDSLSALALRDDITLWDAVPSKFMQMDINVTGPEPYNNLQDAAVREAIAYGTDRQALVDTVWGGFGSTDQYLISKGLLGDYTDLVEQYVYDPDRARQVLEDAGWIDTDEDGIREKDGKRLALRIVNGWPNAAENGPVPEVLQSQWAEIGIEVEIINVSDFPGLASYLSTKEADIFLETWSTTTPDPCSTPNFGYKFLEEPNIWQGLLSPGYVGFPEITEQIDNCASATTQAEAEMWAAEAIRTIMTEARTSIGLFSFFETWASGPNIISFEVHPNGRLIRWEATEIQ